jgi:hypothetical protein
MKLTDFICNKFEIHDSDKLTSSNFWSLFEKIKTNEDILLPLTNDVYKTGDYPNCFANHTLKNLIDKNHNINIFSFGPDICMPPVKDEIQLSYSSFQDVIDNGKPFIKYEYTENIQDEVMQIPFKTKLDISVYEKLISHNIRIISTQVYLPHPNVFFIPIGIQLHGTSIVGQNFCDIHINLLEIKNKYTLKDKNILCYLNCKPDISKNGVNFFYGNIREKLYDSIKDNKRNFITVQINDVHNNSYNKHELFIHYYETLCKSKFCFCPPNIVPDTYRIWDCLYMGCIPIVLDFEGSEYLKDLPIMFIDSYMRYFTITEEELNIIYDEMIDKEYNFEKLTFNHWEKYINTIKI